MVVNNIYVAGHRGMVGSAILRQLNQIDNVNVITRDRCELDLTDQKEVERFFSDNSIDQVYLAAAKVGGIHANNEYPADFIRQNLSIQLNVIEQAFNSGVKKLLFLGSSCIYPKFAEQPMSEDALLTGELESTTEPYAIAKIAGIKLCESYNRQHNVDYRSVMPTNLYGPFDNFHLENSHVLPALLRRFHTAKMAKDKVVPVWGSGNAKREFLYVDDMAEASIYVMGLSKSVYKKNTTAMNSHINIGTGFDCSIRELAETIAKVVGFNGSIDFDLTKPDGAPRKLMNVSRVNEMGWHSKMNLFDGIALTYEWFLNNQSSLRLK